MADGLSGVLVNRVQPTSPTARVMKKGDVLLAFDGVKIAKWAHGGGSLWRALKLGSVV
jgi:S1-C subfamily serine protease